MTRLGRGWLAMAGTLLLAAGAMAHETGRACITPAKDT
jgi:hypothetical protein